MQTVLILLKPKNISAGNESYDIAYLRIFVSIFSQNSKSITLPALSLSVKRRYLRLTKCCCQNSSLKYTSNNAIDIVYNENEIDLHFQEMT